MRHVVLSNCKPGFKKVSMNHLLRDHMRLTLSGAKAAVDRLLDGEEVTLEIDDGTADHFVEAAKQLGADARVIDNVASDDPRSPARA
jgi:hypothetical protein